MEKQEEFNLLAYKGEGLQFFPKNHANHKLCIVSLPRVSQKLATSSEHVSNKLAS